MARRADAAIGARVVEAVTMATHSVHCTLIDVCGKWEFGPCSLGHRVTASCSRNLRVLPQPLLLLLHTLGSPPGTAGLPSSPQSLLAGIPWQWVLLSLL